MEQNKITENQGFNEHVRLESFLLKGRKFILKIKNFPNEIDVVDSLTIDHSNIVAELLTFANTVNNIGILLADAESVLETERLELKEATDDLTALEEKINLEMYGELKATINSPTKSQISAKTLNSPTYIEAKKALKIKARELIEIQRQFNSIKNYYWAAKIKATNLEILGHKIIPLENLDEIQDQVINNILIQSKKIHS